MGREYHIPEKVVFICEGSKCKKAGSKHIYKDLKKLVKEHDLKNKVELIIMECSDRCKTAPNLCIQPENLWLPFVKETQAEDIFKKHILKSEQSL